MPLIFENLDDRAQPLPDRLQAVATGANSSERTRIYIEVMNGLYSVSARAHDRRHWYYVGNLDNLISAFSAWLKGL